MSYFKSSSPMTKKTISTSPSPKAIPKTSARAPSVDKPAPLRMPCKTCGRGK